MYHLPAKHHWLLDRVDTSLLCREGDRRIAELFVLPGQLTKQ